MIKDIIKLVEYNASIEAIEDKLQANNIPYVLDEIEENCFNLYIEEYNMDIEFIAHNDIEVPYAINYSL